MQILCYDLYIKHLFVSVGLLMYESSWALTVFKLGTYSIVKTKMLNNPSVLNYAKKLLLFPGSFKCVFILKT